MKYGLKTENIEKIISIFSSFEEVEEAILYGSRAKGNYKDTSDIDITLKGNNLSISILSKISWELDDLFLPQFFDISIYSNIKNTDLIDHIERVGKVLYCKKK